MLLQHVASGWSKKSSCEMFGKGLKKWEDSKIQTSYGFYNCLFFLV